MRCLPCRCSESPWPVFCILYVTNPFFCHEASVPRGTFAVDSLTPCLRPFVSDHSSCAFRLVAGWLQMNLAERDKKRHNLTLHELEKLPEGTPTYDSCGKMFILVIKHHSFFAIIYLYIHCRLTLFYCLFSPLFFLYLHLQFSSVWAIKMCNHTIHAYARMYIHWTYDDDFICLGVCLRVSVFVNVCAYLCVYSHTQTHAHTHLQTSRIAAATHHIHPDI